MKNQPLISALEDISIDAFDLVSLMIQRDSKSRPTASQVCQHPYFWDSQKRSSFLCDFSDRLEAESLIISNNGEASFNILNVERCAQRVVGDAWNMKVDQDLLLHLSKYRSYDPSSVRDCLRMIRNKHHHFDEIPIELRQRMFHGSESLQGYFESKFPRLVQHCYAFCRQHLSSDDPLMLKFHIPSCKPVNDADPIRTNHVLGIPQNDDGSMQPVLPLIDKLSVKLPPDDDELVIWEGSNASKTFNCRGWMRSQEIWTVGTDITEKNTHTEISNSWLCRFLITF